MNELKKNLMTHTERNVLLEMVREACEKMEINEGWSRDNWN